MGLSSAAAAAAAVPLGDCGSGKPAESFTNRDGEASGDEVVEAETDPLKKKKKEKKKTHRWGGDGVGGVNISRRVQTLEVLSWRGPQKKSETSGD